MQRLQSRRNDRESHHLHRRRPLLSHGVVAKSLLLYLRCPRTTRSYPSRKTSKGRILPDFDEETTTTSSSEGDWNEEQETEVDEDPKSSSSGTGSDVVSSDDDDDMSQSAEAESDRHRDGTTSDDAEENRDHEMTDLTRSPTIAEQDRWRWNYAQRTRYYRDPRGRNRPADPLMPWQRDAILAASQALHSGGGA